MLGSYSDKENLNQLHNFEEDDDEEIKLMLVIDKLREGNHVKGINGIVWLRQLDENSLILLQQQLGRCIFAVDKDNPLSEDEITRVIDLPNNILNANWDKIINTYKSRDDVEILRDIVDWVKNHGDNLPDIESNGREEYRKAVSLKRIQAKYSKYLEESEEIFEDLGDDKLEEINKIIELGEEIDLWNTILPDKLDKDGKVIPIDKLTYVDVFRAEGKISKLTEDVDKLENETSQILGEQNSTHRLVKILRILKENGIDITNIKQKDTIESILEQQEDLTEEEIVRIKQEVLSISKSNLGDMIGTQKKSENKEKFKKAKIKIQQKI